MKDAAQLPMHILYSTSSTHSSILFNALYEIYVKLILLDENGIQAKNSISNSRKKYPFVGFFLFLTLSLSIGHFIIAIRFCLVQFST